MTLGDLLLEKMQIVKIGEKDVKDTIILLPERELGESDNETVNVHYVAELLAEDWGFYCTVTTNLKKTRDYTDTFSILNSDGKKLVKGKIDTLLDRIEKQSKSFKWKMWAKVGTKAKWYADAEDVENR